MLKKLLCFILSALLLCACLPASAEDEASPYVDIWIENSGYGTLILFADGYARLGQLGLPAVFQVHDVDGGAGLARVREVDAFNAVLA